jgi:hypothetical protein
VAEVPADRRVEGVNSALQEVVGDLLKESKRRRADRLELLA